MVRERGEGEDKALRRGRVGEDGGEDGGVGVGLGEGTGEG